MPSAGALPAPFITPVREHVTGLASNHIDTSTYIDISVEAPNCKLYFTTDGSKPAPFQRKIGGKEFTFKYFAPFTLKPGKRTVRAIAVSKDKLHESAIVSKTFQVSDIGEFSGVTDSSSFFDSTDATDTDTSATLTSKSPSSKPKRKKSPVRRGRATPKEAWATSGLYDGFGSGTDDQEAQPAVQIPDGPFNPTNYSGTQINIWGAPPGSVWPGMNAQPGMVALGNGPPLPQYPVQYGFLTEQMIQGLHPVEKKKEEGLTLGDIRKLMDEQSKKQPPPKPAIEYRPTYQDPPLNAVSPGNGDFKENMLHIYAHMVDYAKSNGDFRLKVAEPKMGKMLEAKFQDEGDGYRVSLLLAKPGVPRGSVRKTTKPPTPPPTNKKNGSGSEMEKKPDKKVKPVAKKDPYYEMETENLNQKGTVEPYANFNAEHDAEVLHDAIKGLGTDEEAIINILPYRSNPQRMETCTAYKTMFGKDLIDDIKGDTSGNFCEVLKSLLMAPAEFDAYQCRKAIKGLGTDEDVLIEILCTRSNAQLQEVKRVYKEKFNKDLEKDIIGDTSGDFKKLLVGLCQANRSDSREVDRNKAHQDAKALYEAGEGKWGTDESRFNAILVSRSYPQLRATFEEYKKISKKDIEEALKSELSGDLLSGMKTIVRCVQNKFLHFARQLQKTMKGIGTDDDMLIRVIVSRCEIDLANIKEEFQKLTGQTLEQYVTDDTSGDYQKTLLALVVGGPPPEMAAKSGKAFVEAVKAKTEQELDEDVKMESEPVQEDPTLKPFEGFNAEQDCEVLRKAMQGWGTDEAAIIEVLAHRSQDQRKQIALTYKTMFGKDLASELSSELSGNFLTLCVDGLLGSAEFDAKQLHNAIAGLGTDEKVLVEIICTRTNAQLSAIKEAYKAAYSKELEADVVGDTSGHFKKLLVGCLQANRPEGQEFDRNKAKQDAQALYEAGEKKWGTDESRFNVVLVSRSYPQLRATFQEYAKLANKDIKEAISSEMSGDLKKGMLAIVQVIRSKATYFATELHTAMKGLGTDDKTLCRVVLSRCEVDMVQIKQEFQRNFKQMLAQFIIDDTSGDYRTMLLHLIGEPPAKK